MKKQLTAFILAAMTVMLVGCGKEQEQEEKLESMSDLGMKGRNLYIGIIQANTDREAAGLAAIWPRTAADVGDEGDIASKAYQTSTDYFRDLFDMSNHGKAKWDPYVTCDLSVVGKNLDWWCVIANAPENLPDNIPVLISANFNPELLLTKWDPPGVLARIVGSSDQKERLPIGPAHGAVRSLCDDKSIVIVRKSGSLQIIADKDLTYETLYDGKSFDLTKTGTPIVYLTPKGVAIPRTRK